MLKVIDVAEDVSAARGMALQVIAKKHEQRLIRGADCRERDRGNAGLPWLSRSGAQPDK
jgi:hypothetical protein